MSKDPNFLVGFNELKPLYGHLGIREKMVQPADGSFVMLILHKRPSFYFHKREERYQIRIKN